MYPVSAFNGRSRQRQKRLQSIAIRALIGLPFDRVHKGPKPAARVTRILVAGLKAAETASL